MGTTDHLYRQKKIFEKMNLYGSKRKPFLFIIDYGKENGLVIPLDELDGEISCSIDQKPEKFSSRIEFSKFPISFEEYSHQFEEIKKHFSNGLEVINLTCQTRIETNLSPEEIYRYSDARYKIYWKDHFVCFSPEIFVKIIDKRIYSFPMKGTIDASVPDAAERLLSNPKEEQEHRKVVGLIRSDLEKVSSGVKVNRYRYLDEIRSRGKRLLQSSSEIEGRLPADFHSKLGSAFDALLPAGSICGYPRELSIGLIQSVENYKRNFYTGVFGIYDGENLDSSVLIRFIEITADGLVYKSGGGITAMSIAESEYSEMIEKVYVPID